MNNFNEIKHGLGAYLWRWHKTVLPTHEAIKEWKGRGANRAVVYVPDRMIDSVNDMVAKYRDNSAKVGSAKTNLPIVLVAMAKDANVSLGEVAGNHVASPVWVTLPNDVQKRVFKMQMMMMDRRVQFAVVGSEETSVRSLATQLLMWFARPENRGFDVNYKLVGDVIEPLHVEIETTENMAMSIALDQTNLTCLTVDVTLRETVPFLTYPEHEKGQAPEDSAGYPVVTDFAVNGRSIGGHKPHFYGVEGDSNTPAHSIGYYDIDWSV